MAKIFVIEDNKEIAEEVTQFPYHLQLQIFQPFLLLILQLINPILPELTILAVQKSPRRFLATGT